VGSELCIGLVEGAAGRSDALVQGLEDAGCKILERISPAHFDRIRIERSPDLVVVDCECPGPEMWEALAHLLERGPRPIVVFVEESDEASTRRAIEAGVTAYVVKGAAPERIRSVLDVAVARFEERASLLAQLEQARSALAGRKLIDRAKGILMDRRGVSEQDAYVALRNMAMNRGVKLHDVAAWVIEVEDVL